MRKLLLLAMTMTGLTGCATTAIGPQLNPAPQARFVISGHRDPGLEIHFRIVYMSDQHDCLIDRPFLGGDVVRTHADSLAIPAGTEEFSAEFLLDKYLPGQCQWRAQQIRVSVNHPPHRALAASWQPMVWVGFQIGTPELEEVRYVCRPPKAASTALWCNGPIAAVDGGSGRLRATFQVEEP